METYRFEGTIEVHGVRSAQDAINTLQTALDDYEDMNPGGATITIHHEKPKLIKR